MTKCICMHLALQSVKMVVLTAFLIFSCFEGIVVNGSGNESSHTQINNTKSRNNATNVTAVPSELNGSGSNKSIDDKTKNTESPLMKNSTPNPHLNNTTSYNTKSAPSTQDVHDGSNATERSVFLNTDIVDLRFFTKDVESRIETWEKKLINSSRHCLKDSQSVEIVFPVFKATVDEEDPFLSFDTIHPALVRERNQQDLVKIAYLSILELWPLLVLCFSCAALSGMIVWLLDSRSNSEQFSKRFWRGICDGMWWAVVTMTTVGYGDKSPKSFFARLFATVWMVTGIVLLSMFTAQVSSRLTTQELKSEDYLDDKKIGVPPCLNDSEYEHNTMMNAIVEVVKEPIKTTAAFTDMDLDSLVVFHCEDKSVDDSWELLDFMKPGKVGAEVYLSSADDEPVGIDAEQKYIKCVKARIKFTENRNRVRGKRHIQRNPQSSCSKLLKNQDKLKFEFKWVYFKDLSQYLIPFCTVIGLIIVAFITGTIWDYCCHRKTDRCNRSDIETSQTGFMLQGSLKEEEPMLEKSC